MRLTTQCLPRLVLIQKGKTWLVGDRGLLPGSSSALVTAYFSGTNFASFTFECRVGLGSGELRTIYLQPDVELFPVIRVEDVQCVDSLFDD